MEVRILPRLSDVDRHEWDALVGDDSPFLEWGWLASLEEAGCVGRETGWLPQHLTLWEEGRLQAACPLYVKGHSQGEFVFDHAWADAAGRAGIPYYPKLLVGVPFTPVTGTRLLVREGADAPALRSTMATLLGKLCGDSGFSSVHVNFCRAEEAEVLEAAGFLRRIGYQFQWENPGWRDFDDYLEALRSKRRIQIRRERREMDEQGVTIDVLAGAEIPDELFDPMYELYRTTVDKFVWGQPYLNREFFSLLAERWRHRLCFFVARRQGRIVGGTFTVRKGPALYGRYWGTTESIRFLHFNVCYYASIEYCLREGLTRFEPGAGGEFKHLRGFDARPTESLHWLREPRFASAVEDFLRRERAAVDRQMRWLDGRSAFRESSPGEEGVAPEAPPLPVGAG